MKSRVVFVDGKSLLHRRKLFCNNRLLALFNHSSAVFKSASVTLLIHRSGNPTAHLFCERSKSHC